MAVQVSTYYPALWRRLDVLQVYLFVGWVVDSVDIQAFPSENESKIYIFCVTVLGSGYFYRCYFVSGKRGNSSFGSIFSVISVYFISSNVESEGTIKMRHLEAADVDPVFVKELFKFQFILCHSFCFPVSFTKQLARHPTLLSPSLGKRVRVAVSSIGWTPPRHRCGRRPILAKIQRGDPTLS